MGKYHHTRIFLSFFPSKKATVYYNFDDKNLVNWLKRLFLCLLFFVRFCSNFGKWSNWFYRFFLLQNAKMCIQFGICAFVILRLHLIYAMFVSAKTIAAIVTDAQTSETNKQICNITLKCNIECENEKNFAEAFRLRGKAMLYERTLARLRNGFSLYLEFGFCRFGFTVIIFQPLQLAAVIYALQITCDIDRRWEGAEESILFLKWTTIKEWMSAIR